MRRLLVIEVETDLDGRMRGKVQRQTHRGREFTDAGENFMASNGFYLSSAGSPAFDGPRHLFVRGTSRSADSFFFSIPDGVYLENLKTAVREYNQKFTGAAEYEILT